MANSQAIGREENLPLVGISFLVFGLAIFSVQDVIVRTLSDRLPALEITFIRGIVAMIPVMIILRIEGGMHLMRTRRPVIAILRGLCGLISFTFYYLALAALTFADAVTLFYSSPLFVTAMAIFLLKEKVGLRRVTAVLFGFCGVIVVARPGGGDIDPAMYLAVGAAISYGVMVILTRKVAAAERGSTLSFYSMITFIVASGLAGLLFGDGSLAELDHPSAQFLFRAWTMPSANDFLLISICGVIAGVGFYCLTQAYRLAPASSIAPFEYSSLPLAVLWGYLFWAELPGPATIAGLALIVGSGLYILHREGIRGRRLNKGGPLRPKI